MIDGHAGESSGRSTSRTRNARSARKTSPLARRVRELVEVIEGLGAEPSVRAVHALRTTIRRVETLLPPEPEAAGRERKLRKQLDRIRKRAGKVRDVDVHAKALRNLRVPGASPAVDAIREALRSARDTRERKLVRTIEDERDRGLVKRLRRVMVRAAGEAHTHAEAAATSAATIAEFGELVLRTAPLDGTNLHRLRIATKRLRYRVEPFLPDPFAAEVVAELKGVQDAIGTWHDWATLGERAAEVLDDADVPVVVAVRARAARELTKAVRVTERVAERLQTITSADPRPTAPRRRKRQRAVGARASVPPSASVSA